MHVASLGPLGTHQAIAVAWGVNAWHLGIFFKVSGVCNLMCVSAGVPVVGNGSFVHVGGGRRQ